jgi:hypothetical protein
MLMLPLLVQLEVVEAEVAAEVAEVAAEVANKKFTITHITHYLFHI